MGRRIIRLNYLFFIIISAVLFQSCPNNLVESIDDDITIFKALNISSTYPAPGEEDAFTDTKITVRFDKDVDLSTITAANIILTGDSGTVSGEVSYNSHTKTVTFTPDSLLGTDSSYTVLLKKGIKSSDGNPLVNDYSWTFTTGISTSVPDGTISAVDETNETSVTLNFTRKNIYVTKMSIYVQSDSIAKTTIGTLGRDFESSIVYTHGVNSGEEENYTFSAIFYNNDNDNSDEKSINVFIDRKAPSAPVVSGQIKTNDKTPTWSWPAVDSAESYRWSYNDSDWTVIGSSTSYTPSSELTDGIYKLYVQAYDGLNWSQSGSFETEIDSTATAPTVYISGYPAITTDSTPTWQWNAVPDAVKYRRSYNNLSWTEIGNVTSYTASPALSDASHTLYVQSYDGLNWSGSGSYTVTIDTTPPAVSYFMINSDNTYTTNGAVNLHSNVSSVDEMRFSNDVNGNPGTWSSWEDYNATRPATWALTAGDGTKKVYAQYKDSIGNDVQVSDTIVLDTSAPAFTYCSINSGVQYSTSRTVSLTVNISGSYYQLRFQDTDNGYTSWITYAGSSITRSFTFTSDGTKTIKVWAKDAAGNISSNYISDSITVDTVHPNPPTISCNTSSPYSTTNPYFTWTSGGGGNGTYLREMNDSTPDIQTTSTSYNAGYLKDGSYTFYVRERDDAGNWSTARSYSYPLNITGIYPDNGQSFTNATTITGTWTGPPLANIQYSVYSRSSAGSSFGLIASKLTSPTYTINIGLQPIRTTYTYYWYIETYMSGNLIGTSPVYQFTNVKN